MGRIIIQNNSTQPDFVAVKYVGNVMMDGRVSKNGDCYCYITTFPTINLLVAADLTKTGNDKFIVQDYGVIK